MLGLLILAQQGPGRVIVLVVVGVMAIFLLVFTIAFARYFSLWLRAFLCRANISFPTLVMMSLRKTPPDAIVRLKIMAVQNGIDIPTQDLERAWLSGADVERAVLAMIRARETGVELDWNDAMRADRDQRLDRAER